ncbi:MAG: pyridoxal phosphate-dependent aminotransferase [Candidatus Marinimicrobia bacterium]|nr:pyridoxal phosphate-dependent aminotransferase [Candidatus Neomarinimicrobiota bacterium]
MGIKLSNRVQRMEPSATIKLFSEAKKMMAEGIDIVNFGVGEPDFDTPEKIKNSGKQAIDDNFTKYTVTSGIPELKEAIIKKFKHDNNLDYKPGEIIVTPGAKAAIAEALAVICDLGDKIVIPAPYWVSYPTQVKMVDGEPIIAKTEEQNSYKITGELLQEIVDNEGQVTGIILNSPGNPTGSVYTKDELAEIAEICYANGIVIIADEIYEKLIYDGEEHISIVNTNDKIQDLTIVINGVSKAYAMTGWRLGYAAGPSEIIDNMAKLQGQTASCVIGISQKAAITALEMEDSEIQNMVDTFKKRRDFLVQSLNEIEGIECKMPLGAFYAFPNVSYYIDNTDFNGTDELSQHILKNAHVAVVSGKAFGMDNHLRFSYANSMENLEKGIQRFKNCLLELI